MTTDQINDAKRYQFLTADHADIETRKAVTVIADAILVRSKSNTDAAIDAILALKEIKND